MVKDYWRSLEKRYAEVIGRVVRVHRELQGTSLTDMARIMGVTPSAWSRVETGVTTMSVGQLKRAAYQLGVAPHVLAKEADDLLASVSPKRKRDNA